MTPVPAVTVPWYLARNPFTGRVFSRASALERSQKCCVYREFGRALVSNCYVDHAFVTQFLASTCKRLLCWTSLFDCVWRHFLLFQSRGPCSVTVYNVTSCCFIAVVPVFWLCMTSIRVVSVPWSPFFDCVFSL